MRPFWNFGNHPLPPWPSVALYVRFLSYRDRTVTLFVSQGQCHVLVHLTVGKSHEFSLGCWINIASHDPRLAERSGQKSAAPSNRMPRSATTVLSANHRHPSRENTKDLDGFGDARDGLDLRSRPVVASRHDGFETYAAIARPSVEQRDECGRVWGHARITENSIA